MPDVSTLSFFVPHRLLLSVPLKVEAQSLVWVSRTLLYLGLQRDSSVTVLQMCKLSWKRSRSCRLWFLSLWRAQMWTNSWFESYQCSCYSCVKLWHAVCMCMCMYKQGLYKSKAKDLLKSGCNELLRPDILTALYSTVMGSKVNVHRVINRHSSVTFPETSRWGKSLTQDTQECVVPPLCCFWTGSNHMIIIITSNFTVLTKIHTHMTWL